ncbi:MAG: pyridoxal 5'-phosphate synthase glutaminase subunit PdxT [Candidatus Acidiferrales bacterium]
MKIGVLAIQGDYDAHAEVLHRLGVKHSLVKTPADMDGIAGLILPGGESTTHLKILKEEGLLPAIQKFSKDGGAFFGTCAGVILLAREVRSPVQESLGFLDVSVERNGYGRQLASHVHRGQSTLRDEPIEMVFIRAPIIESVGTDVKILAQDAGRPVLVEQGRILAATFHPELTRESVVHQHFLAMCQNSETAPLSNSRELETARVAADWRLPRG